MVSILTHFGLEMFGSGCYACLRCRCKFCRAKLWVMDSAVVMLISILTVHFLG